MLQSMGLDKSRTQLSELVEVKRSYLQETYNKKTYPNVNCLLKQQENNLILKRDQKP